MRAIALTAMVLASFLGTTSAGTLYSLREDGVLRSYDPATGELRVTVALALPGKVVRRARALAVDPRSGDVLALASFVDDCHADPSRTRFVPNDSCDGLTSPAECESAFMPAGSPVVPTSCVWRGSRGCEACRLPYDCTNTCLPPPVCEGTVRTAFAGTGRGACRKHDGDATGCGAAYHVGMGGPSSCYYADGLCLGCDPVAEAAGACTRECAPPVQCGAEGRTVFAGGLLGCSVFDDDASACGLAYSGHYAANACVYDDGYCAIGGSCEPPKCAADPSRNLMVGRCDSLGGDRTACESTVALEEDGVVLRGCYFDETTQTCASCNSFQVSERKCIEPCDPPVCREQPGRMLAGLDEQECRAFDGNAAACGNAFVHGRCGPVACRFEPVSGACRACEPGDPGGCENACGAFDIPAGATLVRIDPASGVATALRDVPGTWSNDLGLDAAGTLYAVAGSNHPCFEDSFLHDVTPGRVLPASVLNVFRGTGVAFDAAGRLNRLITEGSHRLARFDMTTGELTTNPVTLAVPVPGFTYVPACRAFVAAARSGALARVEPDGGVHPVAFMLVDGTDPFTNEGPGEIVGIAATLDAACPPETVVGPPVIIAHERLAGRRLVLRDRPGWPEKRRMTVVAKDEAITLGRGPGSPDDPTTRATLSVRATAPGGFDATYALDSGAQPLGEWKPLVRRGRVRGWRWSGPPPVTSVVLKAGRGLRIAGRGALLQHTLETSPRAVAVELTLGERPYCFEFGGTVRERAARRFEATDAPVPASCRAATTVR